MIGDYGMAITKASKEWFIYFVDLSSSIKPHEPRRYDGFGGTNVYEPNHNPQGLKPKKTTAYHHKLHGGIRYSKHEYNSRRRNQLEPLVATRNYLIWCTLGIPTNLGIKIDPVKDFSVVEVILLKG